MNFAKSIFEHEDIDNKIAYIVDNENITYSQIKDNAVKLYNFLKQQNISAGENIVLLGSDSHYFVSMILASWAAGVSTYCPTPSFSNDTIKVLCDDLKVTHIFCNAENSKNLKQTFSQQIVVVDEQLKKSVGNTEIDFYSWKQDETAMYFNTTGSTGIPKLIPHTMKNAVAYAEEWADALQVKAKDTIYCCPKICFNYGFGISLLVTLLKKATAILHKESTNPKKIKEIFDRHNPSYFFIVPDIAHMLTIKKIAINFDRVKKLISAGDHLPIKIADKFETYYNKKILDTIGMAETFGFYTITSDATQKKGTLGKPMPNVEVKIIDGLIHVKTNYTANRYLSGGEKSSDTFKDGWVKTRDKGHIDNQGYLVFEGRIDNLIKIKSKFVAPIEIEEALLHYPNIVSSFIFTRKDDNGLPVLCANIVCDTDIDILDLKKFLAQRLESHKIPKDFYQVDSIKTTYNGKKIRQNV